MTSGHRKYFTPVEREHARLSTTSIYADASRPERPQLVERMWKYLRCNTEFGPKVPTCR
jgi:hypothetical protein